ncbi:hypothetical protein OK016_21525 [Vibrio chagasii]|nr:hypothetical protein [Vibrio chagasii]
MASALGRVLTPVYLPPGMRAIGIVTSPIPPLVAIQSGVTLHNSMDNFAANKEKT